MLILGPIPDRADRLRWPSSALGRPRRRLGCVVTAHGRRRRGGGVGGVASTRSLGRVCRCRQLVQALDRDGRELALGRVEQVAERGAADGGGAGGAGGGCRSGFREADVGLLLLRGMDDIVTLRGGNGEGIG